MALILRTGTMYIARLAQRVVPFAALPATRIPIRAYSLSRSTSTFGRNEESFFNIRISGTDYFSDIIGSTRYADLDIGPQLQDLLLEDFDRDSIRLYKPLAHKNLPRRAQTFLYKLSLVVNNNYAPVEPKHVEHFIHDLMDNVLKAAGFEDGTDLILMPCTLRLQVGTQSLAAYADREGRRGTEIIWILDEDKHKFDRRWKKGDIKLVANMIAAVQANDLALNKVYPANMLGIKFDADCLYFYSAFVTKEYLDDLANEGRPSSTLEVKKFPEGRELSLSIPEDRKEIFTYLSALRNYALDLEPSYSA